MDDLITRQTPIEARRYTFGNDEFSLEYAYHDCKLVFDGITDDDSFQEADTGLILYYANEIIYALQEALEGKDTNVPTNDCISRQAVIDAHYEYCNKHPDAGFPVWSLKILEDLPSAQPEIIRCEDCANCQIDDVYHDYWCDGKKVWKDHFCGYAERRTDEHTVSE